MPLKSRERYEKKIRRYGALCRLAYGLPDDLTLRRWTEVMMFGRGSDNYLDTSHSIPQPDRINRYFEYLDNNAFAELYPSIGLRSLGDAQFDKMIKSIKRTVIASENSKQATTIEAHVKYRVAEGLGTADVVLSTASEYTQSRPLFPAFSQHFRFGGVLNTLNDSTIDFWRDAQNGDTPIEFNLSNQMGLASKQLAWGFSLARIALKKRPIARG